MTSQRFDELITRSIAFFTELKSNNNKAFYEDHKQSYTDDIKRPAEDLLDEFGQTLSALTHQNLKGKLFRIHRDVRFSKDKTPYNTHLHLMWKSNRDSAPAYFFGASPDYVIMGAGLMGLQGASLERFRAFIDAEGDAVQSALDAPGVEISDWGPPPLKRVPKPFAPDHPHQDLLKRKALAAHVDLSRQRHDVGFMPSLTRAAETLLPLWSLLDRAAAE